MLQVEVENHENARDTSVRIGKLCSPHKAIKNKAFTPLVISSSGIGLVYSTLINHQSIIQLNNESNVDDHSILFSKKKILANSNAQKFKTFKHESPKTPENEESTYESLNAINAFIKKNDEEINSLTSTLEINYFYEYTEACIEEIKQIDYSNIRKSKSKFFINEYLQKKKLAIFDLDETLVHCVGKDYDNAQFTINVNISIKKTVKVGINLRPFWKEALDLIKNYYTIVIFTASHESYADAVLNLMDPHNEYFRYRLYRHHCSTVMINNQIRYLKDLEIIQNINLKDMILIDNSVLSFAFQLDNGVPIIPYYNAPTDSELFLLSYYLGAIASYNDLREANRKNINLKDYNSRRCTLNFKRNFKDNNKKKNQSNENQSISLEMKELMSNNFKSSFSTEDKSNRQNRMISL